MLFLAHIRLPHTHREGPMTMSDARARVAAEGNNGQTVVSRPHGRSHQHTERETG